MDDRFSLQENPYIDPPTLASVLRFWEKPYNDLYIPLTYTVWAVIARFSGAGSGGTPHPRPFHTANLLFHMLNAVVVFFLLRLLVQNEWAAGAGALLFGVHPVQVEPVAWATGMKDLLSGFLSLIAIWQYLLYARSSMSEPTASMRPRNRSREDPPWKSLHYLVAVSAYLLALLAKPTTVAVPLIAWLLDVWVLGRPARRSIRSLAAWAILAIPIVVIAKIEQPDVPGEGAAPLWARPLVMADTVAFYTYKLIAPFWLGPDYGRRPDLILDRGWVYVTWIVPVGLGFWMWLGRSWSRWLKASVGVFVIGLLPVSGLVSFDFQRISTVADRYLYLSMLGPALALAWFLAQLRRALLPPALACGFLLSLASIASALQVRVWRDSETLFTHALRINPDSSLAHYNLGNALFRRGSARDALAHYREALRLKPSYADARNNLAVALLGLGKIEEAIVHYREALRIDPLSSETRYNLGNALAENGELEEAIVHFREAIRLAPANAAAHNSLANALYRKGRLEEAVEYYRSALGVKPDWAEVHYNLGVVLGRKGDLEGAADHFRAAVRLEPEFAVAHEALGKILMARNKEDEAVEHLEKALQILKAGSARARR